MDERRATLVGVGGVVVATLPFQLLATNDGPRHVLSAAVHANPAAFPCYEPIFPPSGALVPALFAPLLAFLSPTSAAEVVGHLLPVVVALMACWAAAALGAARVGLIIAPIAALNQALALGFVPYEMALATGFAAIATVARARSVAMWGVAALLLWIAARCHVVAAAGSGCLCAALAVERFGWLRGSAAAIGLGAAPGSVVLALAAESKSSAPFGEIDGLLVQAANVVRFLVPIPLWLAGPLGLLLAASLVLALRRGRRPVVVVAFAFLVLSLVLPRDVVGWQFGGLRLLPFVVVVTAAVTPDRARIVAAIALTCASLGFAVGAVRASQVIRPILEGIDKIAAPPTIEFDFGVGPPTSAFFGASEPLFSAGQLIALRFGTVPLIGQHLQPGINNILERCLPSDFPAKTNLVSIAVVDPDAAPYADLLTWASHAEGLMLVVHDDALEAPVARALSFEERQRVGPLRLGLARRCPLRVVIADAVPDLDVAVGYVGASEPARVFQTSSTGALSMELPLPCGARQLFVRGPGGRCREGNPIVEVDGALTCTWQIN